MDDFQTGDAVFVAGVYFDADGAHTYIIQGKAILPSEKIVRLAIGTTRELLSAESVHRTQAEAVEALGKRILQHAQRVTEQATNVIASAAIF